MLIMASIVVASTESSTRGEPGCQGQDGDSTDSFDERLIASHLRARMAEAPSRDGRRIALDGARLLAAGVILRLLEVVFSRRPAVALVVGAIALDYWARRIGARWSPAPSPAPTLITLKRWLRGFAFGSIIALFVAIVGAALGAARIGKGTPDPTNLALAAFRCAAVAFRDELLFRGIPLALGRDQVPKTWLLVFSALLGMAPIVLDPGVELEGLWLVFSAGLVFALIWQSGEGGLVAWAAHTGWLLSISVGLRGGLLQVDWNGGLLTDGAGARGVAALLAAGTFSLVALISYARTRFFARPRRQAS
jgi:hypothetical protein